MAMPAEPLEGGIDLKDPTLYEKGDFHAAFTRLRAEDPVHWNPEAEGPGFWALTKYDDVEYVSKNPKIFGSAREIGGHRIFDEIDVAAASGGNADQVDASMISMDPPQHIQYRRMVTPGFTAPRLKAMEDGLRARAAALVDRIADKGEAEFISAIAAPFPIETLAELFGVPASDGPKLFEWSNAVVGEDDPEMRSSQDYIEKCVMDMAMYSAGLWAERKEKPGDDLISMLANSDVEGGMSMERYLSTFILLVVAGNETTRNSISGGLEALDAHPDQRDAMLNDLSLLQNGAAEIVRWVTPVLHMRRTAVEDAEIRGQRIAKGDKIVMWYCSANRDEDVFDAPFRFDLSRADAKRQIGFGTGQHTCLGNRLAELQIRVMYEELFTRLPDIRLAGPTRRLRSNFISGIKEMPVTFTPEKDRRREI